MLVRFRLFTRDPQSYRDISVRKFAVLLAVLFAFGCGSDTSDGSPTAPQAPSFIGTYRLVSITGLALPMRLIDVTTGITLFTFHDGSLEIRQDQNWSGYLDVTPAQTRVRSRNPGSGTWTASGDRLRLSPSDGSCTDEAIVEGRRLRISTDCDFGVEMIWER